MVGRARWRCLARGDGPVPVDKSEWRVVCGQRHIDRRRASVFNSRNNRVTPKDLPMKLQVWGRIVVFVVVIELLVVFKGIRAFGVTFTNDTLISATDFTYEGQDIVVSNCVLTLDGPHSFLGLRVSTGGMVTHLDPLTSATNAG